jgi:YYY domain-containing protein
MTAFLSWYLLIVVLGWLTFPLAYYLFPALADRGYTLSRAFGMLVWGYVFWLFASFGIAQNDIGGLLLGLVILGGLSAWAFVNCRSEITHWINENRRLVITSESLFLVAFAFMAFVRAANPEIVGTEKPMELMFINGILNSPTFPPRDLWLSGYSISYYYFGYVMASMLAMFTGVPATMAFNLMISLIFGLSAVGAYGILYNLLGKTQLQMTGSRSSVENNQVQVVHHNPSVISPLLAPLFLLIVSNAAGFLEVLHRRGLFWSFNPDGSATSSFWSWLDLRELSEPPTQPLGWIPERYLWWWRASRVIQDYDLNDTWREVINEFPFFSYLLSDLHPHVLAMPFNLLAVAVALNLFFGGWPGRINLFFGELRINKVGFFLISLVLGGLAFLNTWDILIAGALIVSSYVLARVRQAGWGWARLEDVLLLGIPAVFIAYLLYLPFHIGFDSQLGGILPNFMYPSRGAQLWVMWGTLFIPLLAYFIYLWRSKTAAAWRTSLWTALGLIAFLLLAMFVVGFAGLRLAPDLVNGILAEQARDISTFIADSMLRRLSYMGGLLTLLALFIPALAFLFKSENSPSSFVVLLIALGALLIMGPEFLYLRDNFGWRINTIFKFYYQAWIVLSLATTYAMIVLLRNLRGAANIAFSALFVLVLIVGLTYPVLSLLTKTNNFKPVFGFTLDDFVRVERENPDEAAAIQWLQSAPDGVVAEAVGGAYSNYARISIYTGLPTVLGWGNHEGQWRDYSLQGSREQDIETLYTSSDWIETQDIINRYDIRYVYVGNLERSTYRINEEKFNSFLRPVFQQGNVTVYEAP